MHRGKLLSKIIRDSKVDLYVMVEKLDITRMTINRWEKNENLHIKNLKLIADYLGYDLRNDLPEIEFLYPENINGKFKEQYFELLEKYTKLLENSKK